MAKKTFEEKIKDQIADLEPKIEKFKTKAIKTGEELCITFAKKLDQYKVKEKDLKLKVKKLKGSSKAALKDLKDGLDATFKDLSNTITKMYSHFKK